MSKYRYKKVQQKSYVDGNTVRKLDTTPIKEKQRVVRKNNIIIKKRKRRKSKHNLKYKWMLFFSICLTVFACIIVIKAEMNIVFKLRNIQSMETKLSNIEHQNILLKEQINKPINPDEIYRIATEKLNMILPTEDNIKYYKDKDSTYVLQKNSIPKDVNHSNTISGIASFILQGR